MMSAPRIALLTVLALTLLTACSQEQPLGVGADARIARTSEYADETTQAANATSAPAVMLAYEHSLDIELPANRIPERLSATRKACATAQFGDGSPAKPKQRLADRARTASGR
jgi:hypothetical protein